MVLPGVDVAVAQTALLDRGNEIFTTFSDGSRKIGNAAKDAFGTLNAPEASFIALGMP